MNIECRTLSANELARVREIDRTERIEALYVQRGSQLDLREGDWSAPPWSPDGDGEHSIAGQQAALARWMAAGATALGAFDADRLVGVGVVLAHRWPGVAQLAYLHVTDGYRARGVGGRLSVELERIARDAGDTSMVVSATPSMNTVDFYRRRGFEPMAEPFAELLELEPDDVHMLKRF